MSIVDQVLTRRRLVLFVASALALAGAFSAVTMPRQEDPRLPDYWGFVITGFPGADARNVERLVVEPIEERLAEVEEIKSVQSTMRTGVALTQIELHAPQEDVDKAWDEVRRSLDRARNEFPSSAGSPTLDRDIQDPEAVVLAITGSSDLLVLKRVAEEIKRDLVSLDSVKRIKVVADPGEQITVEYNDSLARRLGVDPGLLAGQLASRNRTVPGGSIKLGGQKAILRINDEFETTEEIAGSAITLPSGSAIPVSAVARVRRGPQEPAASRMRFNGVSAVGLGIIPRDGLNVVEFGRRVRERVQGLRGRWPDIAISEVTFQPARVEARLRDLGSAVLMSVAIVAGVLVLVMGVRLGLIVASIVPIVALSSLAVFHWGGGVLHQVSIAAFVIALGILVDNAIVVAEHMQTAIDKGASGEEAAASALRDLAAPLAAATATTLAAFVPMLTAQSTTADFTRALPVVIMITLTAGYCFAVSVTPMISATALRANPGADAGPTPRVSGALAHLSLSRPGAVVVAGLLLTGAATCGARWVDCQFFPGSDRNQIVLDLRLPEGAHLDEIDAACKRLEVFLGGLPEAESHASFVGRGVPHFYYNLPLLPNSPHLAQVIVNTVDRAAVRTVLERVRTFGARVLPHVELVARRLEQGPPVDAPVELRVVGPDGNGVREAARTVLGRLRAVPGAVDVRHDMGLGVPSIRVAIDDASASRYGMSRSDVALTIQGRTWGLDVGQFRGARDPIPIFVRSSRGEHYRPASLQSLDVSPRGGDPVPLGQLGSTRIEWQPSVISHNDRRRCVTVRSQSRDGVASGRVLESAMEQLRTTPMPPGTSIEVAGAAEKSSEANAALFCALPFGLGLLVAVLLLEFNSFRRVAIILVTVPLAITGIVPGLLVGREPFGFMSLLGVFALSGIVVNNAIVLVDRIDCMRTEGRQLEEAIAAAVNQRTRPIILTSATTILGLLPLALSDSNLWPPLAWAMISGLIGSTGLTLLVAPALYLLFFRAWRGGEMSAGCS